MRVYLDGIPSTIAYRSNCLGYFSQSPSEEVDLARTQLSCGQKKILLLRVEFEFKNNNPF